MADSHALRALKWFAFWTLLGLLASAQLHVANQRFAAHPPSWWQALATGLPDWYLWGLLALVVAWLGRRFQVDRANFGRHFFIHLGASLDLALVHLVAAVGLQDALHALRGEPYAFAQQLGILSCLGLMLTLPLDTWIRLAVWLVIGFAIYFGYSRKHSALRG